MDNWPSGGRDTVEFPSIGITINPDYREHLKAFFSLEGIGWNDFENQEHKGRLSIGPSRLRTYRKLYQNLGILYKSDDKIALSKLGIALRSLETKINEERDKLLMEARKLAVGILSRYQLANPTEVQRAELPEGCDIQPCICIWRAMRALDNKLHYEELNRVILRIMYMRDIDAAILRIQKARLNNYPYSERKSEELNEILGQAVHTDQPVARCAYWFSFAGWGGLLIDQHVDVGGFRQLIDECIPLIDAVLKNPPKYFETDDADMWAEYYLADAKVEAEIQKTLGGECVRSYQASLVSAGLTIEKNVSLSFVVALLSKRFSILTGLSGSGKTLLAHAFAKWISPRETLKNAFAKNDEIKSARSVYTIKAIDSLGMKVNQSGQDSLTFLPFDLIESWVKVIREKGFGESTPSQTIQDAVLEHGIAYSPTLNSFHAPLKAMALHWIKNAVKSSMKCLELVSVGADWTNNENLLGYPDALKPNSYKKPDNGALDLILRAKHDPDNPYFLLLDEMNLSHVERYFADFLSSMESGEPLSLHDGEKEDLWDGIPGKLTIPDNLFVIGTVNVDETTYMFSPKVLDRANVVEFRVSDKEMKKFLQNPVKPDLDSIAGQGAEYAKAFVSEARDRIAQLDDETLERVTEVLMEYFPSLKEAGAEFGYRSAFEICRFVYFHRKLSGEEWDFDMAMDAAIMQKLLPKLHGSKKKLRPVLDKLKDLCGSRYPVSAEKIGRMQIRLEEHGFTSFAEA